MTVITNTSPIIVLAKIKRLVLLKNLYGELLLSPSVKVESIDMGKERGADDVVETERGIREGWVKLVQLSKKQHGEARKLVARAKIGSGEAEALVLARDRKAVVVLDDKEARALARSWGLNYTSTVMVLYKAYVENLITFDELVEDLRKLSGIMWISTDVITEVIRKAREVGK